MTSPEAQKILTMLETANPMDAAVCDKPKDFRAIIAVNNGGDILVLDHTQDCDLADLFANGKDYDDNCITLHGEGKSCVGMYYVKLTPWSHRNYEGDYDFGIDAEIIEVLSEKPYTFLE